MNLALRPDRWPFGLEKWYIDVLMEDGGVLLVYLARLQLFGFRVARVTAELFKPDGSVVRGDAPALRIEGGPDRLLFGTASIEGEILRFETPTLSGELRTTPRFEPVTLREPFLVDGGRRLEWVVEVPDADVQGELRWPGGRRAIVGRGYRDHVWFDFLPWRFPIRTLLWGRAVCGPHASTWVEARTNHGVQAGRWVDGRVEERGDPPVELGPARVLLESHVVDLDGLRLGAFRPLLRLLSGDPAETKFTASACVDGREGRAIHEVVRWS